MPAELEDAANKGRAKRAAADADKTRAQARREAEAQLEREHRFWASLSRWGIFRVSGMGGYYLFFFWLAALAPLNILLDPSGGLASGKLRPSWPRSTDHNRPEVRWFHVLTQDQLRALHERFPIAALAFKTR